MQTTIIHKSEIATASKLRGNSPIATRLAEYALFYSNRGLPGDGRICRHYRRLYSAQVFGDIAAQPYQR